MKIGRFRPEPRRCEELSEESFASGSNAQKSHDSGADLTGDAWGAPAVRVAAIVAVALLGEERKCRSSTITSPKSGWRY
jgi:hypothetical protein